MKESSSYDMLRLQNFREIIFTLYLGTFRPSLLDNYCDYSIKILCF